LQAPFGRLTEHGTGFREVSLKHWASTPVIERAPSPLASAPVATRLEAPLLAMMVHLMESRDQSRRLPRLRLRTRHSPHGVSRALRTILASDHGAREGDQTALMTLEGAVCTGLSEGDTPWMMRREGDGTSHLLPA
jgi:hypothetical protein